MTFGPIRALDGAQFRLATPLLPCVSAEAQAGSSQPGAYGRQQTTPWTMTRSTASSVCATKSAPTVHHVRSSVLRSASVIVSAEKWNSTHR